jgi:hypothetical protein
MTKPPHETITELLSDPTFVDRLADIRDNIASLERLNDALDTLWAKVRKRGDVPSDERRRIACEINAAKEILRRSGMAVKMVRHRALGTMRK